MKAYKNEYKSLLNNAMNHNFNVFLMNLKGCF